MFLTNQRIKQPALVFKVLINLKTSAGKLENAKHNFSKMREAFYLGEKKLTASFLFLCQLVAIEII